MKHLPENLKIVVSIICLFFLFQQSKAQSILGTWQLVKQTSCLEDDIVIESDSIQALADEMKSMSSSTPQIVRFKEKGNGEESTRILNKKKSANNKSFLYKFTGDAILILDKKSQTLIEGYIIDKLSADSLILSNSSRACETKVFIKIKDPN